MQSRYYNPDWGRFINADAIIGQIGVLLSHNMFSYCANNPTTMKDPTGFMHRLAFEDGGGVLNVPTVESTIIPDGNQVKTVTRNALVTGVEGGVSSTLSKVPDAILLLGNRAARRAGQSLTIPIKGASAARGIGNIEKIGVIGVALTGVSVWDNYHSGYSKSEAFGRSAIDVGVSAAVIIIGLSNPVGWAVGAGIVLGVGGEVFKNYIWKKE